jgi:hypothetical protein
MRTHTSSVYSSRQMGHSSPAIRSMSVSVWAWRNSRTSGVSEDGGAGASAGNIMDARGEVEEFIEASKGLCGRGDGNGVSKAMDSGDPNRGLCLSGLSSSGGLGDRNMSIFVRQFDDSSVLCCLAMRGSVRGADL